MEAQKKKRRKKQRKESNSLSGSTDCLLMEMPFAEADIQAEFSSKYRSLLLISMISCFSLISCCEGTKRVPCKSDFLMFSPLTFRVANVNAVFLECCPRHSKMSKCLHPPTTQMYLDANFITEDTLWTKGSLFSRTCLVWKFRHIPTKWEEKETIKILTGKRGLAWNADSDESIKGLVVTRTLLIEASHKKKKSHKACC